jgi:hypothetical protein
MKFDRTRFDAFWIIAVLISVVAPPLVAEPKAAPPRQARFLAVGDMPPFRQEIRDGVRYELEPPADSLPPAEITVGAAEEAPKDPPVPATAGGAAPLPAAPLHLGRIGGPLVIPAGAGPLDLLRSANGVPGERWLRLQRPETGNLLVLMWRDPRQEDWKSPSAMILSDDASAFPADTVRIVNLFPQAVRVAWGKEMLTLEPRKTLLKPLETGTGTAATTFQILATDSSGRAKRYYSGAVTQNPGERGWVIIHRADGEAPRRPLKVVMLREPMPKAPVPAVETAGD